MSDSTKSFLVGLLVVVVLLFGGLLLKVLFFTPHSVEKSIDTAYGVTEKTMNADNAIYNYEWFKKREGEIEALYKNEERAKQELEDFKQMYPDSTAWTREDKNEYSRLRSNITAVGQMLDRAIEEYNAKSEMANRSIFKDNLPSNISRAFYAGSQLRNQ